MGYDCAGGCDLESGAGAPHSKMTADGLVGWPGRARLSMEGMLPERYLSVNRDFGESWAVGDRRSGLGVASSKPAPFRSERVRHPNAVS